MKLALVVVVVLSVLSFRDARAEDANAKPAGSCMPIGLTASGELVFPWDCRQIIERQRGPVSLNTPNAPADAAQREQGPDRPEKETHPDQAAATAPAPAQPEVAPAAAEHAPPAQVAIATAPIRSPARPRPKRHLAAAPATDIKKPPAAAQPQQQQPEASSSSLASTLMRALK